MGFGCGLNFHYNGEYFANDFNGSESGNSAVDEYLNDAFYIINLDVDYRFKFSNYSAEFFVVVDNVLNKRHNRSIVPNAFGNRFFEPAPGRSFFAGIKLGFSFL